MCEQCRISGGIIVDEFGRRYRLYHLGEEEVSGTVIGPITWPYEFWGKEEIGGREVSVKIAKGHFENDDQAEEWFKENYSEWYKNGVEMRCFDV